MKAAANLRKARGVYYTPPPLIDHVLERTLVPWLGEATPGQVSALTILDPACGAGDFLGRAYRLLLDWYGAQAAGSTVKGRILQRHIFGVDIDEQAVAATRAALQGLAGMDQTDGLQANIRCGNALVGPELFDLPGAEALRGRVCPFDWTSAFPFLRRTAGFTLVVGNPPWGQKAVADEPQVKRYLRDRFPSSRGIHDLFRPFVELAVRLTAPGGRFGMVLPDIVLLKNYAETRRFLLDHLTLTAIDWWGRAFTDAVIDTVTIVGERRPAPAEHRVAVAVHDPHEPLAHAIPQSDFRANPRQTFNLHLTAEKRRLLDRLAELPRLGEFFEVHEGVHSGNVRAELFVCQRLDDSCRELYFGRDEIEPYRLRWQGRYLRLSAVPERRSGTGRYANVGRRQWHERPKVLVRRTGDHVRAAVDDIGRYASNNFFLVFHRDDRGPCSLDLDGLCALLNSRFMTEYFRIIEPRRGRVFAELKIKHLVDFPLPRAVREAEGCRHLNELGARRKRGGNVDDAIEQCLATLFGLRRDGRE
jgi:hypothetical protein